MTTAYDPRVDWAREDNYEHTCDYALGYGLPHTVTCGAPAAGQWHAEDDEWFCTRHMQTPDANGEYPEG